MNLKQKLVDSFPLYSAQDISPKELVNHGVEGEKKRPQENKATEHKKKKTATCSQGLEKN